MIQFLILCLSFNIAFGFKADCASIDVRRIIQGCDFLKGFTVITTGGTIINDHNCDISLPKQVFLEEPYFEYSPAETNKLYTVMLLDLDAFEKSTMKYYLHMLKSNIPGKVLKTRNLDRTLGMDYVAYKAPSPPRATSAHRYALLLFEQADGEGFKPPASRARFEIVSWIRRSGLCGPIAGVLFRTQF